MRFATITPQGIPHVVPMAGVYEEGTIYMDTDKDSKKIKNVTECNIGAVLVDEGENYNELRGILLQGEVNILENQNVREYVINKITAKYTKGKLPNSAANRNEMVDRVVIELIPKNYTSWDFRQDY
jgi:nitroimidazol reductase NimA-like FMN-containing flavoprotein (pyridoxamine 5'-phosphate oxidase superfamily)